MRRVGVLAMVAQKENEIVVVAVLVAAVTRAGLRQSDE